ncbi:hypothetical protein ALP68_102094 [Pseudomonas ficuserectae]|uniref:Uncharacterized protein n=2 Tax=Pseudomonas syringae group TaxID=136849 RepID=A0A9X0H6S4_PSESX|nr:hypothetical protein ALO73_102321 [Pseudomonas syringae pv. daphniphylli]KPX45110.1 hypothetical protein ALO69_102387 [Pseudomonas ficuserectae]KPZ09498.1 hypothetical protein ALO41_102133 [Pseudomonas amygdali pv. ulmi]RMM90603.1 hypothetical protein ALQ70_102375 [Pseudomonas savastanoi pv. glycinea]RMS33460.1 hypothetical protein ALP68_102094 [Pseudomonas ficuserectae]
MGLSLDFNLCLPRIVGNKRAKWAEAKGKSEGFEWNGE